MASVDGVGLKDQPAAVGGVSAGASGLADSGPADSGLIDQVRSLWYELRGLVHDGLTLAALETRQAGRGLVTMVAAGVGIAILVVSAWLGLLGAAVLGLIAIGVNAAIAMLLAVAANLGLAALLYQVIRRQTQHLRFSATLRSLRPAIKPDASDTL